MHSDVLLQVQVVVRGDLHMDSSTSLFTPPSSAPLLHPSGKSFHRGAQSQ